MIYHALCQNDHRLISEMQVFHTHEENCWVTDWRSAVDRL